MPSVVRGALYALFVVAGAASVPFLGDFGPLPTTTLLDIWLVAFVIISFFRGRTESWVLALLVLTYLCTRVFAAIATYAPLYDFLQAYRWVFYLLVIAFAIGRKWGPIKPLIVVTWILLSLAVIKAGLTLLIIGPGERPGLLLENNFELALFAGLIAVIYRHLSMWPRMAIIALMGGLTILAGSRSGAVVFFILAVYAILQARNANAFLRYILLLSIPVFAWIALSIFESRAIDGGQIDRINFLTVFLAETQNWDLLDWLFGTTPITPLSPEACRELNYYQSLFSSTGDGTCYSVVLHSFLMRVTFDAGLVGLGLSIVVPWYAMLKAGCSRSLSVALVAISVANGASVSGLNNPYVTLPILVAILVAGSSHFSAKAKDPTAFDKHESLSK